MRLATLGLVVACMSLSCFSTRKYDEAHAARVAAIDREYAEMEADVMREGAALRTQVDSFRDFLLPVKSGSGYRPAEPVWEPASLKKLADSCEEAGAIPPGTPPDLAAKLRELIDECIVGMYKKVYLPALTARYYRADLAWVFGQATRGTDLESLLLYSHNTEVLREVNQRREEVDSMINDQVRHIRAMRSNAIAASMDQRNHEVAAAREQHRAQMMAFAAALQAMAQPQSSYAASERPVGCSSDFECTRGWHCLKNNYAVAGVCVKSVNEFGNQTFDAPRGSSVGPKLPVSTDCKGVGDCPVGFRCDLQSGACLK